MRHNYGLALGRAMCVVKRIVRLCDEVLYFFYIDFLAADFFVVAVAAYVRKILYPMVKHRSSYCS